MLLPHRHVQVGAFEQLFGSGSRGFQQKFSRNLNAQGVALGEGGMLKLRFDWYVKVMDKTLTPSPFTSLMNYPKMDYP